MPHMPHTSAHRTPHHNPVSLSPSPTSPTLPPSRRAAPLRLLLLSILLALLHPAFARTTTSSSDSDAPAPVASSSTATGRTDVWPDDSSSAASWGETPPDGTSSLRCVDLVAGGSLSYNQSVECTIECKAYSMATPGRVSSYSYSAEELSDARDAASTAQRLAAGQADDGSDTGRVWFGTVSNFTLQNESKVISFVYTAPAAGSVGVLHVRIGPEQAEIMDSPIIFTLSGGSGGDSGNGAGNGSTPTGPAQDGGGSGSGAGFVSLSNPAFLAVCGVAVAVLVAAVGGGLWARRVFARKADEVRSHAASERQWAHAVPSMQARLDVPQSSTLRSPLLR